MLYLQVLWLADNLISSARGLQTLTYLQELNLARNQIEQINNSFSKNTALKRLNLSDNLIGSFKQVHNL